MAGTVLPAPAGTDLGWGLEGARWHHSRDWPLTSSGVGLENRPPQPFPPPAARSTVHEPLPPGVERPPQEELIRRLATTTGLCHDVKTHGGVLGQPSYLLPAPLWRVHCNKDLRDKAHRGLGTRRLGWLLGSALGSPARCWGQGEEGYRSGLQLRAWRVPLTPGGQPSETRHRFCGWPNLPPEPHHHAGPQPFALAAHHSDGASKSMVASTENRPLAGSVFYVRDGAVLSRLDPYVSVTSRDIRAFSPQELQGHARKDALTYWQFEGYPKAWGHGLKDPSLGKDAVPLLRPPSLPRNPGLLPSPTHRPRLPTLAPAVPHQGALSLAQESYGSPRCTPSSRGPPARPPTVCPPAARPQILAVPLMYRTEYQSYGSSKPGPV
ncbi:uncharacterized protein LOC127036894 [Gopherus flavomarginatus]|uniref:uncharacterized protein LOC127036894 n=1 Tax=Gopherus flavomarginatus TaxID=286002 RepID=UPI0021CC1180|nr:uncharacterized protein LOC127036894 [Gopherus flavomarginatus]